MGVGEDPMESDRRGKEKKEEYGKGEFAKRDNGQLHNRRKPITRILPGGIIIEKMTICKGCERVEGQRNDQGSGRAAADAKKGNANIPD
jgi:hypothetical protein